MWIFKNNGDLYTHTKFLSVEYIFFFLVQSDKLPTNSSEKNGQGT